MNILTYLFNWFFNFEPETSEDPIELINQLFDEAYFSNFPDYVEIQ